MSMFEEFEDGMQRDIDLLVEQYETARRHNKQLKLDQDAFEQLIDYYLDRNEIDRALDVADISLEHFPYSGVLLLRKAELLFENKQLHPALDLLAKAEIYDPSETGIYLLRAEILTFQSRYKEAIAVLEEIMTAADDEEKVEILLQLADVYEDWQRYDDVFSCLQKALQLEPNNEEALNRANYCVEITQQYEESVAFHKLLIDNHPYSYLAWYNLACAYTGLELYEKAVEALEYVLAINEDATFCHHDIADLYYRMGRFEDALKELKEYHALAEPDEEVYFLEGRCHESLGNLKMARYLFRKAIHIYPGFQEAYYRMGDTYRAEENWQLAFNAYEKAAELDGNELDHWIGVAEAALHLNDMEQLIKACNKAIEVRFNHFSGYFLLAKAHAATGDFDTAMSVLQNGMSVCKDEMPLRFARIALWLKMGMRKEAELEWEHFIDRREDCRSFVVAFSPELENDPLLQEAQG